MKKIIFIILSLNLFVSSASAVDFKMGVSNGFTLPFGVQLTKKTFRDMSISEQTSDFKITLWNGKSLDYKETDVVLNYKNLTLALFDIPGKNNIIFTAIKVNGFVFKTLNPKGKKSGIQLSKKFDIFDNISIGFTAGTAPFSGAYLFTPDISYKNKVSEGLTFSVNYKHPMGEASRSLAFDPSLIAKLNFSF